MFNKIILIGVISIVFTSPLSFAQEIKPVKLPVPNMTGGMPLMEALRERQTTRSFKPDSLSSQTLSDLLWAAFGINRPGTGKRTAPSALNWQETEIYVAMEKGVYIYDAKNNTLIPVNGKDMRGDTGTQAFIKDAPVNLVYVSDYSKMSGVPDEDKAVLAAMDAAFIAENVYLYCASFNLGVVVRGSIDKEGFAKKLNLPPEKKVILAQTVGYPN